MQIPLKSSITRAISLQFPTLQAALTMIWTLDARGRLTAYVGGESNDAPKGLKISFVASSGKEKHDRSCMTA